jgi:hypothetical protein
MNDLTRSNLVDDYLAGKLPDELRGNIDPRERVTVSIAVKEGPVASFREIFESLHNSRLASNDPVMRIRALREESDERDRFLAGIRRGSSG